MSDWTQEKTSTMRIFLFTLALVPALSAPAHPPAQQPASPPAGSNWQHVQALPIGASLQVQARKSHANCTLKSVDADSLTCTHKKDLVFQRTDILSVKIPHRGRSTLIAAGIGIGALAIAGAASGSSCTAAQKNSFLGCFNLFSRGDLALAGGAVGGVIGSPIGYFTDFAKSTVYQAP
jgi:hypothetical protein